MLYPSIQELLKSTEKNGEERLNKYSIRNYYLGQKERGIIV